jgi:Fur family peroxide stress response transcriptional regulator
LFHGDHRHEPGDEHAAEALLRGAGLRLTPQRLAIAREVLTNNHPTAAEVFEALQDSFPTMGLATVYSTLNVMVEHGLLRPLAFEGAVRFDANLAPHANLICTGCGRITDFEGCHDVLQVLQARAGARAGFLLEEQRVDLYGRCWSCHGRDLNPRSTGESPN